MIMRCAALATTLLVLWGGRPAAAQDAPAEDPDTWGAEIGFTLSSSGGNEELTLVTSEIGLTHLETSSYEANVGSRFRYGTTGGDEVARNLRGNLSVDLWPSSDWSPFVFATGENDPFKSLELRLNGGVGLKHTFWQDDWDEVSLSGAVLYSYENLEVADTLGTGISQTARWSWRGRGRTDLGEGRRVEQTVFFQPNWYDWADYLLEAETTARWPLTQTLSFTTTFQYDRDSTPAPEVLPDDWSLAVGLSLATRW